MLILTRRIGETVKIGDDISVTILGVKGNQIRVGISAPKDVAVHREEVYLKLKSEKKARKPKISLVGGRATAGSKPVLTGL